MTLNSGVLRRIWVSFPPGPRGEVFLQVFHWGQQILPVSPGEALAWDGVTFDFPLDYDFNQIPFTLTLVGWSPTANFAHTVSVRAHIEEPATAGSPATPSSLLDRLSGLFTGQGG